MHGLSDEPRLHFICVIYRSTGVPLDAYVSSPYLSLSNHEKNQPIPPTNSVLKKAWVILGPFYPFFTQPPTSTNFEQIRNCLKEMTYSYADRNGWAELYVCTTSWSWHTFVNKELHIPQPASTRPIGVSPLKTKFLLD